jgi:hypothetical protein
MYVKNVLLIINLSHIVQNIAVNVKHVSSVMTIIVFGLVIVLVIKIIVSFIYFYYFNRLIISHILY